MKLLSDYLEAFDKKFSEVEFLHGVPVSIPLETKQAIKQFLSDTIKEVTGEMVVEKKDTCEGNRKGTHHYECQCLGYNSCRTEILAKRDEILGGKV